MRNKKNAAASSVATASRKDDYPAGFHKDSPAGSHYHALVWVCEEIGSDGSFKFSTDCDLYGRRISEIVDRAVSMGNRKQRIYFVKRVTQIEDVRCTHPIDAGA